MDSFNLWMHTYTPSIDVNDVDGKVCFKYQSLAIPRIGENICWNDKGKYMNAKVVDVYHEVTNGNIDLISNKICITIDEVEEM